MDRVNVTTDEARQCIEVLKRAEAFMTAANLAARMTLRGGRETRRRHVRAIVKQLRDDGQWIVAQNPEGYFLTQDESLWKDYLEGRKIESKRVIGETARRQKMVTDRQGQGLLFAQMLGVALGTVDRVNCKW
ncbi:MAG: hypothetical protein WC551_11075 [Patescibacteria group bacterium]